MRGLERQNLLVIGKFFCKSSGPLLSDWLTINLNSKSECYN